MTSSINFPCKACGKNVSDSDQAIQCDLYDYCNNLNYIYYKFLQNSNDPWYFILCCSHIFPFNSMKSNKSFSMYVSSFHNNNKPLKTLNNERSLWLKRSENLQLLVNQCNNNASPEDNTDSEDVLQSKYYDIEELQSMKIANEDKSLALFHINACSLSKTFDDLEHLLSCTNKYFGVIPRTKAWVAKSFSNK